METDKKAKKGKVLVVDDDITSLDIVSYMLEQQGFSVERSADGYTAVEQVKSISPDAMVVDLMMPGINGAETVRQIREQGFSSIPIIAFTAVDDPEYHEQARQAGCNEVLTKPCRPEKLVQHILNLLAAR